MECKEKNSITQYLHVLIKEERMWEYKRRRNLVRLVNQAQQQRTKTQEHKENVKQPNKHRQQTRQSQQSIRMIKGTLTKPCSNL